MYFVDTNLLVYLHDSKELEKQERARKVTEFLWTRGVGRLSYQVLQEFYAVSTRKLKPGLPIEIARQEVADLMAWNPLSPSAEFFEQAWEIEDRWKLSWWDSLIVAAAKQQDCSALLSEDLQDGFDFDGLRVMNPFSDHFNLFT